MEKILSSLLWGITFIVAGVLLLLQQLGVINFKLGDWWPLIFVVIGLNIIISGIAQAMGRKN